MCLVVKLDQDLCRAPTWSEYDDLRKRLKQLVDPVVELIRWGDFHTTWRIRAWLNVLVQRKEWLLKTDQCKLDLAVFQRAPFLQDSDDKEEDFDSDEEEDSDKAQDVIMKLGKLLGVDDDSDSDQNEDESSDGMLVDEEEEYGGSDSGPEEEPGDGSRGQSDEEDYEEQEEMEADNHRNSKAKGKKRKAPFISDVSSDDDDGYRPIQVKRAKVRSQARTRIATQGSVPSPTPLKVPCERCRLLHHDCLQVKANQACARCRKDKRPCTFSARRGGPPPTPPSEPEPKKSTTSGKSKGVAGAELKTPASTASKKGKQLSPASEKKRASVPRVRFEVPKLASPSTPLKKGTQGSTVLRKEAISSKAAEAVVEPQASAPTRTKALPSTLPAREGAAAADLPKPASTVSATMPPPMARTSSELPPLLRRTLSQRPNFSSSTAAPATLSAESRWVMSMSERPRRPSSTLHERGATAAAAEEPRSATSTPTLLARKPEPILPVSLPGSASTKPAYLGSQRGGTSFFGLLFGGQSSSSRPQGASVVEAGKTPTLTTPSHEKEKEALCKAAAIAAEPGPAVVSTTSTKPASRGSSVVVENHLVAATSTATPALQRSVPIDPQRTTSAASASQEKQTPNQEAVPAVPRRNATVGSESQASLRGSASGTVVLSPVLSPSLPEVFQVGSASNGSSMSASCSGRADTRFQPWGKTASVATTERDTAGGRTGQESSSNGRVGTSASEVTLDGGRKHTEETRRLETQIRKLEEKCENHEMRLQKLERDVLELKATLAASKRGATVEREPPLPIRNFMQEFESRIEAMTQRLQTDIRVIIAQEFRALDSLVTQRQPAQTPMFTSASFTQAQPPTIQAQRQQYW